MPLSVGLRTVNLGTRSDRFKQGKELRRRVPRETHADLKALVREAPLRSSRKVIRIAFRSSSLNVINV